MRKPILFLLFSLILVPQAQAQTTFDAGVNEAQARVWDIGFQLNSAIFKLNVMKLDWQKDKLTAALTQAQQAGDTVSVGKIQDKLADIDHRKDVEKQKLDLNNQLIAAKQQGDQGKVDAILFQLKSL
jgi:hypothetical protein